MTKRKNLDQPNVACYLPSQPWAKIVNRLIIDLVTTSRFLHLFSLPRSEADGPPGVVGRVAIRTQDWRRPQGGVDTFKGCSGWRSLTPGIWSYQASCCTFDVLDVVQSSYDSSRTSPPSSQLRQTCSIETMSHEREDRALLIVLPPTLLQQMPTTGTRKQYHRNTVRKWRREPPPHQKAKQDSISILMPSIGMLSASGALQLTYLARLSAMFCIFLRRNRPRTRLR